jgi:hypothetical protein
MVNLTPRECPLLFYLTECTYGHFNASSSCPVCNKTLGANDFTEVVVADPSTATEDSMKNAFQTLFTKYSANSNEVSFQEMCTRLLRSHDDHRRTLRFLLKQFSACNMLLAQRTSNMGCAYQKLQEEHTKMQQAVNSQRIQSEQTIGDLQHRLQALTATIQERQQKLDEKDKQIQQFRSLYAADGERRMPSIRHAVPGSSYSAGSSSQGRYAPPPMQSFAENKKRRETAKQANLVEMTRSRNVMGPLSDQQQMRQYPSEASVDSAITPIVPPPKHQGSHHHSSNSMRMRSDSGVPPPPAFLGMAPPRSSPRIRDLTPGSGYQFTSRSSIADKRPRTHGGYATSLYDSSRAPSFGTSGGYGRR